MVTRGQLAARIGVLLVLCRRRPTTRRSHLNVSHVLLIRVLLQVVDLADGLAHLPLNYFWVLYAIIARTLDRSLLTTIAVGE